MIAKDSLVQENDQAFKISENVVPLSSAEVRNHNHARTGQRKHSIEELDLGLLLTAK